MTPAVESGRAAFRPRARIIKLFGEQLIRNEIIAVLELVKNAYDADATECHVRVISGLKADGYLEIEDNGCGMSLETILGSWMEPATDSKIRQKMTPEGRRVQGEKGVGRFAADKISRLLTVISKTSGSSEEVCVEVDWDLFEDPNKYLQDVNVKWEKRTPLRIKESGTVLKMERLRTFWDDALVGRLRAGLDRLVLAFGKKMDFNLFFESDDFPDLSGEVVPRKPPPPHYEARGIVENDGTLRVWIAGKPRVLDAKRTKFDKCGPLTVELRAWEMDESLLKKVSDLSLAKARLLVRSWSGVSVYLDEFRVYPYGEPGDDWLELDQRRINRPVVRFSNSQLMGSVRMSKDANPGLVPQTNREGLIQNDAFGDLKAAVLRVIVELENFRLERSAKKKEEVVGRRIALDRTQLTEMKSYVETTKKVDKKDLIDMINNALVATDRSEEFVLAEIARYRRLATLGTLAGVLVHEVSQQIDSIARTANTQKTLIERDLPIDRNILRQSFERIERSAQLLGKTVSMWQPFIRAKSKPRDVDVVDIIESVIEARRRDIEGNDVRIKVKPEAGGSRGLRVDPADVLQIFANLLDNSLYWLKDRASPEIRITVRERDEFIEVLFSDNGPGIPPDHVDYIFTPFWSTKAEGSGLGLTIVGETLADMGGTISLVESELGTGASFRIRIPKEGG